MILIDDRAGSADLIEFPPLSNPEIAMLCRLDSADAYFGGNGPSGTITIGIEVKSVSELLTSIANGRFNGSQVPTMIAAHDVNYLAFYGGYKPDANGKLLLSQYGKWVPHQLGSKVAEYSYLEGFLSTLATYGFRIKHIANDSAKKPKSCLEHLAHWIYAEYLWWQKPWADHGAMDVFDRSTKITKELDMTDPRELLRANIAKELPGIGYKSAKAIARAFPTLRAMLEDVLRAPECSIAEVRTESSKGRASRIGPVVAKTIARALDE